MVKKIVIGSVAILVALAILGKTHAGHKLFGLASLCWHKAGTAIENQVPPEVEVERIKQELSKRNEEMKKHLGVIAEEVVAVENIKEEIVTTRANLKAQHDKIFTMKNALETAGTHRYVSLGDQEYPAARVRDKLARDWASYKNCEEALKTREKLLDSKEAALTNAREQLAEMRSQYEKAEVELAQLETDIKAVRLAETRSKFQLDDSHLARIKEAEARLRDRVKTMKVKTDLEGQFANDLEIKVEKPVQTTDLLKEIDDHFGKGDASALAERK